MTSVVRKVYHTSNDGNSATVIQPLIYGCAEVWWARVIKNNYNKTRCLSHRVLKSSVLSRKRTMLVHQRYDSCSREHSRARSLVLHFCEREREHDAFEREHSFASTSTVFESPVIRPRGGSTHLLMTRAGFSNCCSTLCSRSIFSSDKRTLLQMLGHVQRRRWNNPCASTGMTKTATATNWKF